MGNLVENGKGACAFGAGNFARLAAVFVFCVLVFSLPAQASVIVRASQLNSSSNLYVGNGSFFVNVSNGYAGVGTTGPERPLHVVAAQDANIRLQDTSGAGPAAYVEFYNDTARWGYIGLAGHDDKLTIATALDKNISFYTNNTPRMTLTAAGNLGLGTTSPWNLLHVAGITAITESTANYGLTFVPSASLQKIYSNYGNSGGDTPLVLGTYANQANQLYLATSGKVGIGNSSPSYKLDVAGTVNAYALYLNGSPLSTSQWTTSGSDVYYSTGSVGIGSIAPAAKLHVNSSWGSVGDTPMVLFSTTYAPGYGDGDMLKVSSAGSRSDAYLLNLSNSVGPKFVVMADGKVGVGTSSPSSVLTLYQSALSTANGIRIIGSQGLDSLYLYGSADNVATIESKIDAGQTAGTLLLNPSGGNIGIGTTSPGAKLHVVTASASAPISSAADELVVENSEIAGITIASGNTSNGNLFFADSNLNGVGRLVYDHSANAMSLWTDSTQRMTISSTGNVGIGTTSPTSKLHIWGVDGYSPAITLEGAGNHEYMNHITQYFDGNNPTTNSEMAFNVSSSSSGGSTRVMTLKGSGKVGIGTTTPISALSVAGSTAIAQAVTAGENAFYGLVTIGSPGTSGGSLVVRTAGVNSNEASGLGIDGSYSHPVSTVNIKAYSAYHAAYSSHLTFWTQTATAPSEKARITSAGYAGIGTVNPRGMIEVAKYNLNPESYPSDHVPFLILTNTNHGIPMTVDMYAYFSDSSSTKKGGVIRFDEDQAWTTTASTQDSSLRFGTALDGTVAEKMRITSAGYVGIGATTPSSKLTVWGPASAPSLTHQDAAIFTYGASGGVDLAMGYNSAGPYGPWLQARHNTNDATAFPISLNPSGGNVGIGTLNPTYTLTVAGTAWVTSGAWSGSDARWKKNVTSLSPSTSLGKVLALRPVNFDWRTGEFPEMNFINGTQVGFIAQEVEKIIPEVVTTDDKGFKGMSYERLTPVLTSAVQEQEKKIEAQQAQIEQLKALVCQDHQSADVCK